MTGVAAVSPKKQFLSSAGAPLVNGTVTVYVAGTTTPTSTWQDKAQATLNTNPITLDSRGECLLWLDPAIVYKFVLKNAGAVEQYTVDNISGASANASLVTFLQAGTGAVERTAQAKMRDIVSVKDFGAVGDGSTDDGPEIQAAIDAVYTAGGGAVYFPTGIYRTNQTITLKYNVSLFGVGNKDAQRSVATLEAGTSLDAPTLINDQVNGIVVGTGIDGNSQRLNASIIQNMQIRNMNTTSHNCDAIRFTNAWTITLNNVGLRSPYGFAARLLDCNVIHWTEVWTSGPVYAESLADSKFVGCQMGPSDSPSLDNEYMTPIFWLSGGGGWKNLFVSNFIFNGPNGVSRACTVTNAVQNIACTGHGYVDGTPIIYESTGTFALDGDTTFYVKVVDANTIKLATSRANLNAGTYLTPSASTTGTDNFRIGGKACLYLNDGASRNTITGNRFDQGYHHGLYLRGADLNTIVGNTIHENGRANATAGISGLRITNGDDNSVTGNAIDGTDNVTATGTSNQDIGLQIASGSARTKVSGNTITNHATSNIQDSSTTTSYDIGSVFLGAPTFRVREGAPALTLLTGNRREAWAMDAAADESVTTYMNLPNGATTWEVRAYTVNMGAGAGDVVASVQIEEFSDGDNISANEGTTISGTVTATTQDLLKVHSFSSRYTPEGSQKIGSVTFKRTGTSGSDTLANDYGFIGLLFKPTHT